MLTLMTVMFLMFAGQDNVLHRAPLDYPRAAMLKGVQGNVLVEVNVDEEGLVTDARVISGPQELRNAALRNVLEWHFSKQMHLPAVTQVTVDFELPQSRLAVRLAPDTKAPAFKPKIESQPVQAINIQGLSGPARDTLLARLPIREGDEIDTDVFDRLTAEVQAFDEHLHVMLMRQGSGVTVDIAPRPAVPNYMSRLAARPASTPIKVSGNVQQAKLIRQTRPVYPPEAKIARVQGLVRMNAVIGREGEVKNLELVSGPPELTPAAMDAVRQWVYEPTRLNGEAVEVMTQIDVNFTLAK
jgi:TonB family protein